MLGSSTIITFLGPFTFWVETKKMQSFGKKSHPESLQILKKVEQPLNLKEHIKSKGLTARICPDKDRYSLNLKVTSLSYVLTDCSASQRHFDQSS